MTLKFNLEDPRSKPELLEGQGHMILLLMVEYVRLQVKINFSQHNL